MSTLPTFVKDPNETLDYKVDWSAYLAGDTITTSTWTVDSGLTKGSTPFTASAAVVWLSGGTDYTTYKATNTIVTAGGRTAERTIQIQIRDK